MNHSPLKVSELWIYPIKSCGGISLTEHELVSTGFRFDRQWMIVDSDGKFITQREYPQMARIQTSLSGGSLHIEVEGMRLELQGPSAEIVPSQVWSSHVKASLEKNLQATECLTDFFKKKVQLVTVGKEFKRAVPERESLKGHQVFFADSHPLLITTEKSLDDLNARLKDPVPMSRFRPNIVIAGDLAPYSEDEWGNLEIGSLLIESRKACSRCPIITIDQNEGVKKTPEPLAVLAKYRRKGTQVYFGVRGWPLGEGRLKVGDELKIAT